MRSHAAGTQADRAFPVKWTLRGLMRPIQRDIPATGRAPACQAAAPLPKTLSLPGASTKGKAKNSAAKAPRRARARKGATEERSNKKAEFVAVMKRAVGDSDAVPRSSG